MTRYSHRDRRRVIKLAFLASAAAALALTVQGADAASLNSVTGALAAQSRLVLLTHGCHSHCRWWPMKGQSQTIIRLQFNLVSVHACGRASIAALVAALLSRVGVSNNHKYPQTRIRERVKARTSPRRHDVEPEAIEILIAGHATNPSINYASPPGKSPRAPVTTPSQRATNFRAVSMLQRNVVAAQAADLATFCEEPKATRLVEHCVPSLREVIHVTQSRH